jgi:hypothetical protein
MVRVARRPGIDDEPRTQYDDVIWKNYFVAETQINTNEVLLSEQIERQKISAVVLHKVSNLEKNSKAWSSAFKHWVDFPKLQKGIFTNVIDWVLRALFTLVGVIILACCFYIVFIIACCNISELKTLLSQIGSIIISFGGWITASVLAIKQKK